MLSGGNRWLPLKLRDPVRQAQLLRQGSLVRLAPLGLAASFRKKSLHRLRSGPDAFFGHCYARSQLPQLPLEERQVHDLLGQLTDQVLHLYTSQKEAG